VRPATVFRLGYRAAVDEAGPAKAFDFARRTLAERWQAGERAMHQALARLGNAPAANLAAGLVLHDIEEGPPDGN
jgi:NTE family protein